MATTSIILKTDSRGRVHTPPQRRAELVAEFERSGLPATKFSALVGVRYQTFATWVQQHRKRQAARTGAAQSKTPTVRFAQVVLDEAPAQSKALRVLLSGGVVLELVDRAQVPLAVQLIQALNASTPC